MSKEAIVSKDLPRLPQNIIRTETVLSRMPIHQLTKSGETDIRIEERTSHGVVELLWDVSYSKKHGPPRQLAYKVDTLIINRRIDELGRPLPKLIRVGSLSSICAELGIQVSGTNTANLKRAFQQNAGVFITAKLTYKDTDGKEHYLEANFTRYSVYTTGEHLPSGETADAVYISLNDPFLQVLNRAPVRPLDYDYLKELPPQAQRLYEIISYSMFAAVRYNLPHAKVRYSDICLFSARKRPNDIKNVRAHLHQAHEPLIASGYIKSAKLRPIAGDGPPDFEVLYEVGALARLHYTFFNSRRSRPTLFDQQEREMITADSNSIRHDATNLVKEFHLIARRMGDHTPRKTEVDQAARLITQHGLEKATFIVNFAARRAIETSFPVKTFGGHVVYLDEAIKAHARQAYRQPQDQALVAPPAFDLEEEEEALRVEEAALLSAEADLLLLSDQDRTALRQEVESLIESHSGGFKSRCPEAEYEKLVTRHMKKVLLTRRA